MPPSFNPSGSSICAIRVDPTSAAPTIFTAAGVGSGVGLGGLDGLGGVVGLLPPGLVIGLRLGFWKILLLVGGFLLANIALGYWEAVLLRRTAAVLSTVVLVELFDETSVSLLG